MPRPYPGGCRGPEWDSLGIEWEVFGIEWDAYSIEWDSFDAQWADFGIAWDAARPAQPAHEKRRPGLNVRAAAVKFDMPRAAYLIPAARTMPSVIILAASSGPTQPADFTNLPFSRSL